MAGHNGNRDDQQQAEDAAGVAEGGEAESLAEQCCGERGQRGADQVDARERSGPASGAAQRDGDGVHVGEDKCVQCVPDDHCDDETAALGELRRAGCLDPRAADHHAQKNSQSEGAKAASRKPRPPISEPILATGFR